MTTIIPLTLLDPARFPAIDTGTIADGARIAGYLSVLGQPNRLRIFWLLMVNELCVCELEAQLGVSPSLLAHHLRKLRESGFIQVRWGLRDARWLYYSINPPVFAILQSFLTDMSNRRDLPAKAMCRSSCSCG